MEEKSQLGRMKILAIALVAILIASGLSSMALFLSYGSENFSLMESTNSESAFVDYHDQLNLDISQSSICTSILNLENDKNNEPDEFSSSSQSNSPDEVFDPVNFRRATADDLSHLFLRDVSLASDDSIIDNPYATGLISETIDIDDLEGDLLIYDPPNVEELSSSSIDLSTQSYFPEVRSQGSEGACAGFATIYYNFGYLEAMDNNWTDAWLGNDEHLMSPAWTYNKVTSGYGSSKTDNVVIAKQIGVCTWAEMPFVDGDHYDWGSENAWRNAPSHRISEYSVIEFNKDTIIQNVKNVLASQHPVSISFDSSPINSGGTAFFDGNYVLSSLEYDSETTGHAVTIVGYNDEVTDDGDIGAFKIVNSWGTGWGDQGYFWMTYETLKEIGPIAFCVFLIDTLDYQPSMVASWEFLVNPAIDCPVSIGPYSLTSGILDTKDPVWYPNPDRSYPTFMCLDISEFEIYFDNGVRDYCLDIGSGSFPGTVKDLRIERYDNGYSDVPSDISAPLRDPVDVPGSVIAYWKMFIRIANESFDGHLNQPWTTHDSNSDYGSDTWDLSTYRSHSGEYSAWCAEDGENSNNGEYNFVNHYYDEGMDAYLYTELVLNGCDYDRMILEFYYWANTGSLSFADYFSVVEYYDEAWHTAYTQPEMNSGGWKKVSLELNNRSIGLGFYFHSDNTVGLGPYEGVYIDDVAVWATEFSSPTSIVTAPSMVNSSTFQAQISADDTGTGVSAVYLFFEKDGSGELVQYTDASNPEGLFQPGNVTLSRNVLGGDGTYGLRSCAVDLVGNIETYKELNDAVVLIDTVAPSCSASPQGTLGENGWYVSSVNVILNGADAGSGFDELLYRVDSGTWKTATSGTTVDLNIDGAHVIEYYGVDKAGLSSSVKSVSVKIDRLAPMIISMTGYGHLYSGWSDSPVYFSMSSSDEESGSGELFFRIGSGDFLVYDGPLYFNDTGTYELEYFATDMAGNQGSVCNQTICVDVTAPVADLMVSIDDGSWSNETVFAELLSSDLGSGIATEEYRLDCGDWRAYTSPVSIAQEGTHLIEFRVYDIVGLCIEVNVTVRLDLTAPVTDIQYDGLRLSSGAYANQIDIVLNASDVGSGPNGTMYSLDLGLWSRYDGAVTVTSTGSHMVMFRSLDASGNYENVRYFNFTVALVEVPLVVSDLEITNPDGRVKLVWSPPEDGGSEIESYDLFRSVDGSGYVKIATVSITTYDDMDVESGRTYGYYIVANNIMGSSTESSVVELYIPTPEEGFNPIFLVIALAAIALVVAVVIWRLRKN